MAPKATSGCGEQWHELRHVWHAGHPGRRRHTGLRSMGSMPGEARTLRPRWYCDWRLRTPYSLRSSLFRLSPQASEVV
jgi:hypothetical protein